ncbi:uncharacterized protein OCT59_020109 [Rhizophagus irregularis]|uniref:uncharacterized protein n=1 Tax=Rhizophagus irregularis TaxID=588596 RepID=UPI0019EB9B36|nr:hypothetical protein OCT59_020109 [Rhizophagus irregularis]GBC25733.2 hypothetical protein GLOIN_2v1783715 [Rhizophagus irregularis DAOM 181602=DAOM 197198]
MDLIPILFRITIFILSFLYMIPLNEAAPTHSSPYDAITEFHIVFVIPITFHSTNILGTLFIFYRTYLRWKRDHRSIVLSLRFPFYLAITDFLYSSSDLINYSYSASNKSKFLNNEVITLPSPLCEIMGFSIVLFVSFNVLLVGAISIITWLRVVQEYYFELGKYDYKIWFPIVILSLIFPLSTLNAYGPTKYNCGVKPEASAIMKIFFILIVLTLATILFCYIHILTKIRRVKEENSSVSSSNNSWMYLNNIEKKTLKKVLTYILVFILQYVPVLIYNMCRLLKIQNFIIGVIVSSAISLGGIGNVIQYICNEGFRYQSSSVTCSDYKSETKAEADDEQKSNDDSIITNNV